MSCEDKYQTAFTLENLSLLEKAIMKGVKRVKYSDKEIEYRSLSEMLTLRNAMVGILNPTNGGRGLFGGKRIVARHSKGLDNCGGSEINECFNGYGDDGDI